MPMLVHPSSGSYNRRISVQQATDVKNGSGGFTRSWNTLFTTWANLVNNGGGEPFQADQVYPTTSWSVKMRYRPGVTITEDMRILYGAHILNIRDVRDEKEEHVQLTLKCDELQAKGDVPS